MWQNDLPNPLVRADIQVQPLLLAALPEDVGKIGFVPDLEVGSVDGISGLQILQQSIQEQVVICPIPVVSRPDGRFVGPVGAPDVVRQDLELGSILTTRLVVGESRIEPCFVFGLAPDPSTSRLVQLSAAGTTESEGNVGVEVIWDLVGLVWDSVDHS